MFTTMARVAPEKTHPLRVLPLSPYAGIEQRAIMAKMTYSEQLKHPNWQRVRLERLGIANWECDNCGDKEKTLHVHHKRYVKGRMAWEYENSDLAVLCEKCHQEEHSDREILDKLLADMHIPLAVAMIAGHLFAMDELSIDDAEKYFKYSAPEFMGGYVAAAADGSNPFIEYVEPILFKHSEGRLPPWLKKDKA